MSRISSARPQALLVTIAVVLAAGCGPKHLAQPTQPTRAPRPALIVLLPDPETGTTGRARVSNEFGSANLAAPRAATRATSDGAPGPVSTMSEAEVKRLFGEALAALPPAPHHFTLLFRFESDALTAESTALVPEILRTVKGLSVPEVVVVGHTDTMGDAKANIALGLKRAISVRKILVEAGLAASTIEVTSHGEADLLVKTPDNTPEPRNRRVEITVR
jgi:outer membrane protein OmpA-like peptidoglycan-associated protein